MELTGILFGLGAVVAQSVSYVTSRLFVLSRGQAGFRLLLASHVLMGILSLIILPLVWHPDMPAFSAYLAPLLGTTLFFLVGQFAMFQLISVVHASRVSPLLGLKIPTIAVITVLFFNQPLNPLQWVAIVLSTLAALLLNAAGTSIGWRSGAWLMLTCMGYSLSDIHIAKLIHALHPIPVLRAAVLGTCLCYALAGLVVCAGLPFVKRQHVFADWRYAIPFTASWYTSMFLLFASFGIIGPVFGNVIQSTRGLVSVVLGAWLAHLGFHHLEARVSRRTLALRFVAAGLMCGAIWLFQHGR